MKETATMVEVRILEAGAVHGDRVLKKGDVLDLDPSTAEAWVSQGRASYTVRVKVLKDGTLIGSRCYSAGDLVETSERLAVRFANAGAVEILDRGQLHDRGRLTGPPPAPPAPADTPSPEEPRIRVKVVREFLQGNRVHIPAEAGKPPVYAEIPESAARRAIPAGVAELTAGAAIVEGVRSAVRSAVGA